MYVHTTNETDPQNAHYIYVSTCGSDTLGNRSEQEVQSLVVIKGNKRTFESIEPYVGWFSLVYQFWKQHIMSHDSRECMEL